MLVVVGAAEAGWGVAALARQATPAPRAGLAGAVLLTGAFIAVLLLLAAHHHGEGAASVLPVGALAGAAGLDLAVAVLLAFGLRWGSGRPEGRPGPYLLGTAIAATAVAVVTATSLAGTTIGAGHVH